MDALQHPMTILPVTLYLLSILYLVLLSPVLGGTAPAIILISVAGVATAANFFWRYFARFDMQVCGEGPRISCSYGKGGGQSRAGDRAFARHARERVRWTSTGLKDSKPSSS